jgi:hypothetical protein
VRSGDLLFADGLRDKHPDMPAALLMAAAASRHVSPARRRGPPGPPALVEAQLPLNLLRPLVFGLLILFAYYAPTSR